jgi:putative NIF3 family GTP cyclohydrolase 1 type 2
VLEEGTSADSFIALAATGGIMTSEDIMEVALDLARISEIPRDSGIHVRSDSIKTIMATIDCDVSDLLLARAFKCDAVLTHHPEGAAGLHGWQVMRNQIEQMLECGVPIARAEAAVQRRRSRWR